MNARSLAAAVSLSLAPLGTGCATDQPLSRADVTQLASRSWSAPTDEVYDATWLTLRAQGYTVTRADRLAGTFEVRGHGRTFDVDVAALGAEQRVRLTPHDDGLTRGELTVLLDALEEGTRSLLRAWSELPEWKYDGRRNVLAVRGFSASPPREWEWIDFDISRRHVVVQARRARTGVNPTVLFDAERVRPEPTLEALVKKAAGLTLNARQRLVYPDELPSGEDETGRHGALRVLDGTSPVDVAWHARVTRVGPVEVQLVMVCPKPEAATCALLWAELSASVIHD